MTWGALVLSPAFVLPPLHKLHHISMHHMFTSDDDFSQGSPRGSSGLLKPGFLYVFPPAIMGPNPVGQHLSYAHNAPSPEFAPSPPDSQYSLVSDDFSGSPPGLPPTPGDTAPGYDFGPEIVHSVNPVDCANGLGCTPDPIHDWQVEFPHDLSSAFANVNPCNRAATAPEWYAPSGCGDLHHSFGAATPHEPDAPYNAFTICADGTPLVGTLATPAPPYQLSLAGVLGIPPGVHAHPHHGLHIPALPDVGSPLVPHVPAHGGAIEPPYTPAYDPRLYDELEYFDPFGASANAMGAGATPSPEEWIAISPCCPQPAQRDDFSVPSTSGGSLPNKMANFSLSSPFFIELVADDGTCYYRRIACPTGDCDLGGSCRHRRYTEESNNSGKLLRKYHCDYPGCNTSISERIGNLLDHEREQHDPTFKPSKCIECSRSYKRERDLRRHVRMNHFI
ncbi:hypothetical protein BC628DRAFT_1506199 [Trametes gibbosa]|uniref:Zinc finger protein 199 n=1 Tax=Trametes gibbosa TaxID=160864 RepID=A0A6B9KD06_9APHY|nr:hypothetical protein BC628DRAFT_1506199 [Trametes gibbosa]QHA24572.1 zinc finger protein 199 [Trametes gibbosa]